MISLLGKRVKASLIKSKSKIRILGAYPYTLSPSRPTVPSPAIIDDSAFFEPSQARPNAVPSVPNGRQSSECDRPGRSNAGTVWSDQPDAPRLS